MKKFVRFIIAAVIGMFASAALHAAGNIKVTLSPASVAAAGARWRVDGGSWQTSGTTLKGLNAGSHMVDFNTVSGWISPSSSNANVVNGSTTTLSATYTQAASISISLTPATGQWRIDGGAWQSGRAMVSNLAPGNHGIEYLSLPYYQSPPNETVTLTAGQVLALQRTYTQLSQITIGLSPSTGQWRSNGGAWQASGASLWVPPGTYNIDYSPLDSYDTPASEAVTFSTPGSVFATTRYYTPSNGSLHLDLTPAQAQWRVDGGTWQPSGTTLTLSHGDHTVDYSSVVGYAIQGSETVMIVGGQSLSYSRTYTQLGQISITLNPAAAQWRVDGGSWLASGAISQYLAPGNHTVDYADLSGYISPASESATVTGGQVLTLTRSYISRPQITITLSPSSAQWRIDGGNWLASGATASNLTEGSHTIDYSALAGYGAPPSESVTLANGQPVSLNRTYTQLAQVSITLTPSNAQWRVDGGTWLASGSTSGYVAPGAHTIDYSTAAGYVTPPSETVTLTAANMITLSRTYAPEMGTVTVKLTPNTAQWQVDGGAWHASGDSATVGTVAAHSITYSALAGYVTPTSESFTVSANQQLALNRTYEQLATISITLTPSDAQWRIDGGSWLTSGSFVSDLHVGSHTIDYASHSGYITPASETLTLTGGVNGPFSRAYTQLGMLSVSLTPSTAQWRVDGGAWQTSGSWAIDLSLGNHTIEYGAVTGYITPAPETVAVVSGPNPVVSRTYTELATLTVKLTPTNGQWRVDGGNWQTSESFVPDLSIGNHTVEYAPVDGYVPPPSESVRVSSGLNSITRTYPQAATLTVNIDPSSAQWRIDGGAWRNSGAASLTSAGTHTIDYSSVPNYTTPAAESVTLFGGQALSLSRSYVATPAQLTITTTPATGRWQAYLASGSPSGVWNASGGTANLAPGTYNVAFAPVTGYGAPATQQIVLAAADVKSLSATYNLSGAQISVALDQAAGQWRVDGGAWQGAGATASGLGAGDHILEFAPLSGYSAPLAETVTLGNTDARKYSFLYVPTGLGALRINLTPETAQWRIDGGDWHVSGATVGSLSAGEHTVEFSTVTGFQTWQTTTVEVSANEITRLNWTYDHTYSGVQVLLNPNNARWRVDGRGWYNSGAATSSYTGIPQLFEFEPLPGLVTPHAEYVSTTVPQQYVTLSKTYGPISGASVSIGLDRMNGSWAIYPVGSSPTTWHTGSATVHGLAPGSYTIEYGAIPQYGSPTAETVTLTAGQDFVARRSYTAFPAQVTMNLAPAGAQWRISPVNGPTSDTWFDTGTTVHVAPGDYMIDYSWVADYTTPYSDQITVTSGEVVSLTKAYKHVYQVTVTLQPYTAQWRIDGGPWTASGDGAWGLANGNHTIEYGQVSGYTTPPPDTITLSNTYSMINYSRSYTATANVTVHVTPATGQWRMDGGPWQNSDATLTGIYGGSHTFEYSQLDGYFAPWKETLQIWDGESRVIDASYTAAAQVTLALTPSTAKWSVDGGPWQASGAIVGNLWPGYHWITYQDAPAYLTPTQEPFDLPGGQLTSVIRAYAGVPQISVTTFPSSTRWRVGGGEWYLSGMTYTAPSSGSYLVEYETPSGYDPIANETVTLTAGNVLQLSRASNTVTSATAGQLIIHTYPLRAIPYSYTSFAVDWGAINYAGWYYGEQTVPLPPGQHSIIFGDGMTGWETPAPFNVNITSGATTEITVNFRAVHHLKFFIHQDLLGSMTTAELYIRLAQYVDDLNTIFRRESLKTFKFDPYYDLTIVSADPFTAGATSPLPVYGYAMWVYVSPTDNFAEGTYGGRPATDRSGAGGGTDFRWDQVYDPSTLADGSAGMEQYWRQLHLLARVLELSFGAGAGEYSSLGNMHDSSMVLPNNCDTGAPNSAQLDPFWSVRGDYLADPLSANAWNNPQLGSPTALADLLNAVHFAPITKRLVNEPWRDPAQQAASLPDLSSVVVRLVDSQTGAPVTGGNVHVFNRPAADQSMFEELTTSGNVGVFSFSWTSPSTALTSAANAKLVKAVAPGYSPTAQWVTIYDAQKAKVIDGKPTLEFTIALTPQ